MRKPTITLSFDTADYEKLRQEFEKKGGSFSLTEYVRDIVTQRHRDTIVLSGDAERMQLQYATKLEAANLQVEQLTNKLASASHEQGLSGAQVEKTSVDEMVQRGIAKAMQDLEMQRLKDEVKELKAEVERLEEFEDMADEDLRADKKMARYAGLIQAASTLPPQILEPAQGLLQGLTQFVTKPRPYATELGSLPDEDRRALSMGKAILDDFPLPDNLKRFIEVARYLKDNTAELVKFHASRAVQAYLTRKP